MERDDVQGEDCEAEVADYVVCWGGGTDAVVVGVAHVRKCDRVIVAQEVEEEQGTYNSSRPASVNKMRLFAEAASSMSKRPSGKA